MPGRIIVLGVSSVLIAYNKIQIGPDQINSKHRPVCLCKGTSRGSVERLKADRLKRERGGRVMRELSFLMKLYSRDN